MILGLKFNVGDTVRYVTGWQLMYVTRIDVSISASNQTIVYHVQSVTGDSALTCSESELIMYQEG